MNPSHDLQGLKKKAKETFLYVLSALLLGIAIGAIDAVFGRVLLFITDFRSAHVVVLLPFLPLAGLGIVWLYRHFNETASKGMTLVMEAGQGKRESIPLPGQRQDSIDCGNGSRIWRPLSDSVCSSLFCDGSSGEWKYGIFRIASCGNCVFYGICNFACSGAGKIFGSSFADPVIDGHKDGDVSDSFWNLVRSDGTAVCGAFAKSKTVYGKRTGKSIQENRLCVDPTGGVPFSGVERTVLRTWNQSDRAGIFRGRTVYV